MKRYALTTDVVRRNEEVMRKNSRSDVPDDRYKSTHPPTTSQLEMVMPNVGTLKVARQLPIVVVPLIRHCQFGRKSDNDFQEVDAFVLELKTQLGYHAMATGSGK